MIRADNNIFYLTTADTEYIFRVTEGGYIEHVYYGSIINDDDITPFVDKLTFCQGNCIEVDDGNRKIALEHFKSELSTNGKGDVREISIDVIHADGSRTCEFVFDSYKISDEKYEIVGLPSSYAGNDIISSLILSLKDINSGNILELKYSTFENANVITKACRLYNRENGNIVIRKLMSNQLDLDEFNSYDFVSFNGAWAHEMNMNRKEIKPGIISNASFALNSSSRSNPFCMICEHDANEEFGEVYGFNLVYSGNHYESVYTDVFNKIRFMNGINPSEFSFTLGNGEFFETPEAVLSYSATGFGALSRNMHRFVRNNIVRGKWQYKERPILINSWESFYFDINERKLFKLAKTASDCGMELFVIDDGWFKGRNDDTSSLGDWEVDSKKLPNGLASFANKLKGINMMLGLWVEPEMVNENSDLYRAHPDWAVKIHGKSHALGRNQMLLDLTKKEVRDYIIDSMRRVFASADIKYIKWDMNRIVSDSYSSGLSNQLEFAHRYMLGLYEILDTLTGEFPEILFESCSGGGNRFDLGMLCYMPQTWASDNTDARCRLEIQKGYSYGYPSSVIGAHVSQCPNHQTLRTTQISSRFDVAAFGLLGYECNFDDFSSFEMDQVKKQVEFYKKYRKYIQFGENYRLYDNGNESQWLNYDKEAGIGAVLMFKKEVIPGEAYSRIKFRGIEADAKYHFTNRHVSFSIKDFGTLVNSVSPVHIRMNSMLHNFIDKIKHMESEDEDIYTTGQVLMNAGVKVKEGFACRGYNESIRFMPDNGTRLYIIEKVK